MYRRKTFQGKSLARPSMKNPGKNPLFSVVSACRCGMVGVGRFLGGVCDGLFLRGWLREMTSHFPTIHEKIRGMGVSGYLVM